MTNASYVQFLRDNGKERPDAPDDEAHWCKTMRDAADEIERLRKSLTDIQTLAVASGAVESAQKLDHILRQIDKLSRAALKAA